MTGDVVHQDVEVRLDFFRVTHVAATNPITMVSQVIGLNSASSRPATIALNPVVEAVDHASDRVAAARPLIQCRDFAHASTVTL